MRRSPMALLAGLAALALLGACDGGTAPTTPPAATGSLATTTTTLPTPTSTTSSTPSTTATPTTTTTSLQSTALVEVEVAAGASSLAGETVDAKLGQQVLIRVTADVGDEVHVHGYDLSFDVTPASPAELEFIADVPGVFEVELEGAGLALFELRVSP